MDIYLWIILIAIAAGLIQGLSGFGGAALAMPLFTLLMDLQSSVVLVTLLSLIIGALNLWALRRGRWHIAHLHRLLMSAVFGIVVGVFSLIVVPEQVLLWILGLLLVGQGVYGLSRFAMPRLSGTRLAYPIGAVAGWLSATVGVPGPPVIVYVAMQAWLPAERKGVMVAFLMLLAVLTAGGHAAMGLTTSTVLLYFLFASPPLMLATLIGIRVFDRMGVQGQAQLVNLILLVVGVLLIYEAFVR
ncbi:MAG: sulfite exporter TauE/SafE family protein [Gammaproteobacteria bacterium]|nr:sulfite exporter TauE/SafE family protein [Gammaproteobacteria bacterium]